MHIFFKKENIIYLLVNVGHTRKGEKQIDRKQQKVKKKKIKCQADTTRELPPLTRTAVYFKLSTLLSTSIRMPPSLESSPKKVRIFFPNLNK